MKTWEETLLSAEKFIKFVERDKFFNAPYSGDREPYEIITDPLVAKRYATKATCSDFVNWGDMTSTNDFHIVFPDFFEWNPKISKQLQKNNYWNIENKDYTGADEKLTGPASCIIKELFLRDVETIIDCYSNDYFPEIWKSIHDIYLADGFPCGWKGTPYNGKIVVFSNF